MSSNSGHVFISHGSENSGEANALSAFLEGRGIRTWIAPRDVRPGMDYSEQLQLAIEQCAAFAVLVTEKANKSPYVRAETEMAFSTNKPIFPIRGSDIQPAAGLALFLKIRHWTDAFGAQRDANLERLAQELEGLTGARGKVDKTQAAAPVTKAPPPPPPTSAPSPPPPPPSPPPTPPPLVDEDRLRAAVGQNAEYYLARWAAMRTKGSNISWNWPACLANVYWFAWRKLWVPMGVLIGAMLVVGLIGATDPAFARFGLLINIGFTFITGAFGNHLYRRHCERLVASTSGVDEAAARTILSKRGGTSNLALFLSIGGTVLAAGLLVAAQISVMQREAEEREALNRVNAVFDQTYEDSGQPEEPVAEDGDKPPDDYYYPEGE